jgi:membrane protein
LFTLGQLAIGYYLGHSTTTSAYAAAAALFVLLLWLYYAAQIFLFGAEITWVYTQQRRGRHLGKDELQPGRVHALPTETQRR